MLFLYLIPICQYIEHFLSLFVLFIYLFNQIQVFFFLQILNNNNNNKKIPNLQCGLRRLDPTVFLATML